jgi:hypothetical protein
MMKKLINFIKDYRRWSREDLAQFRTDPKNLKYVRFGDFLDFFSYFVCCFILAVYCLLFY